MPIFSGVAVLNSSSPSACLWCVETLKIWDAIRSIPLQILRVYHAVHDPPFLLYFIPTSVTGAALHITQRCR